MSSLARPEGGSRVASRIPKKGGRTRIPWRDCWAAESGFILCGMESPFLNGERYSGDGYGRVGQGVERFLSEEAAMVIVKVDFRVVKLMSFR